MLIRELADRARDTSALDEVADWAHARSRLCVDARAEGVTVAQALGYTHAECVAAGIKPTQKFSAFLKRLTVDGEHQRVIAGAEARQS